MTTPIVRIKYSGTSATSLVRDVGVAVHQALDDAGRGIDRACYVVPGDIAWDECHCGMLAQTITQIQPTSSAPQPAVNVRWTACGPGIALVNVTLVVIRCVPIPDENGNPPTCDALDDAAVILEQDRHLMRKTVACYLQTLRSGYEILEYGVNVAASVGPLGACAGVELPYWFAVQDDCC